MLRNAHYVKGPVCFRPGLAAAPAALPARQAAGCGDGQGWPRAGRVARPNAWRPAAVRWFLNSKKRKRPDPRTRAFDAMRL
jgi:hypothetical protein